MFGITDGWISLVFGLCILSAILCAVYGIVNWNKGMETEIAEANEVAAWEKVENEIDENM